MCTVRTDHLNNHRGLDASDVAGILATLLLEDGTELEGPSTDGDFGWGLPIGLLGQFPADWVAVAVHSIQNTLKVHLVLHVVGAITGDISPGKLGDNFSFYGAKKGER